MTLRKSTKVWLAIFAGAVLAIFVDGPTDRLGAAADVFVLVAIISGGTLYWRGEKAVFRAIARRLTLRLAFSYFLIGIVPIPLLATLLFLGSYLVGNQYMASRLRREITAVGEHAAWTRADLPVLRMDAEGRIAESGLAWLERGEPAPWQGGLDRGGFLVHEGEVWFVIPDRAGSGARILQLTDPQAPWLQQLADRTGYAVSLEIGETRRSGDDLNLETGRRSGRPETAAEGERAEEISRRPLGTPPAGRGLSKGEWVRAFYLETALNAVEEKAERGENVVVLTATTSPKILSEQLFAQGVPELGRVFWVVFAVVAGTLLVVYLVALAIAFVLVGSIARNVNRLTKATEAISRGDFTVRVRSKSKDQIGDLARSFDGMAASIEGLLIETGKKERLEAEIAIARAIQQKLLPPSSATLRGLDVLAHFQPVVEIGGDYYDYMTMPDGRTAVMIGDVSGHGLPTGLLAAMAKAGLLTLIESGVEGSALFARLNELIYRSTDPRTYMTLALLAYDAGSREGALTNAGHLAPYRLSEEGIESLSLPAFPLGLFADRTFPTKTFRFRPGDRVLFVTDGFVEATDGTDEPFGFERLEALLRPRLRASAEEIRDALLRAVEAHTGGALLQDDRTLVVLTLHAETSQP